jgi:hypothetical protein
VLIVLAVPDGDIFTGGIALVITMLGILIEANRRWNNRLENTVTDHAETAKEDTKAVAKSVGEIRFAQTEINSRLHDTRERLARIEGTVEFVVARQTENLKIAHSVSDTVDYVQKQLTTVNGLEIGQLADREEGRRIKEIPEHERTRSEQRYADNLDEGGRGE